MTILDYIVYDADGTPKTYQPRPDDEAMNAILAERNDTLKLYNDLIKSGRMDTVASYVHKDEWTDPKDGHQETTYFFVFDPANITDSELAELHEKYPLEKLSLTRTERFDPCVECGCVALACGSMRTYRDTYGTVGRSWEHPMVQRFFYPDCEYFSSVLKEKGPAESGKAVIERLFDGKACSDDQYTEIMQRIEAEWRSASENGAE